MPIPARTVHLKVLSADVLGVPLRGRRGGCARARPGVVRSAKHPPVAGAASKPSWPS